MSKTIYVPTSVGELIDKITILRIKLQHITDAGKLDNVRRELGLLEDILAQSFPSTGAEAARLADELHKVNQDLWTIEDAIRDYEHRRDFGEGFISLARSVYTTNDRRAALKRHINLALGSALLEEKSYANH